MTKISRHFISLYACNIYMTAIGIADHASCMFLQRCCFFAAKQFKYELLFHVQFSIQQLMGKLEFSNGEKVNS